MWLMTLWEKLEAVGAPQDLVEFDPKHGCRAIPAIPVADDPAIRALLGHRAHGGRETA
jgi:hypothetical protein